MGYNPWGHKESDMKKGLTHKEKELCIKALEINKR